MDRAAAAAHRRRSTLRSHPFSYKSLGTSNPHRLQKPTPAPMVKTARYDDEAVSSCEEQKDLSDAGGSESGEEGEKGEADEEEIEAVTTSAGADEQADGGAAAAGGEEDEEESESTDDDE